MVVIQICQSSDVRLEMPAAVDARSKVGVDRFHPIEVWGKLKHQAGFHMLMHVQGQVAQSCYKAHGQRRDPIM